MTESVNPLLNASGLIDYASVRPEHVAPAVETLSKNLEETLARVTAPETPATWEAVAEPLEKATLAFTRGWGVVGHLQSVVDTPALRDAYNAALPAVTQLFIDLSQNEALFAKYKAMKASDGFASLPPVRRRIIERELRDFRLSVFVHISRGFFHKQDKMYLLSFLDKRKIFRLLLKILYYNILYKILTLL